MWFVLADIMTGEVDLADICFLAAMVVSIVAAVLFFLARNVASGFLASGVALISLGFMAL